MHKTHGNNYVDKYGCKVKLNILILVKDKTQRLRQDLKIVFHL